MVFKNNESTPVSPSHRVVVELMKPCDDTFDDECSLYTTYAVYDESTSSSRVQVATIRVGPNEPNKMTGGAWAQVINQDDEFVTQLSYKSRQKRTSFYGPNGSQALGQVINNRKLVFQSDSNGASPSVDQLTVFQPATSFEDISSSTPTTYRYKLRGLGLVGSASFYQHNETKFQGGQVQRVEVELSSKRACLGLFTFIAYQVAKWNVQNSRKSSSNSRVRPSIVMNQGFDEWETVGPRPLRIAGIAA